MKQKKLFAAMLACILACTGAFSMVGTPVEVKAATVATESGVVDLGEGTASITIWGNGGQSLIGKQFRVYKLFDAENSAGGESINYTYNDTYKAALQNVVGARLSKTPSSVTEYEVIDYIQSLNTFLVEGAHAEQSLEGNYSDFRYFVEDLRDEIERLGCDCDVVDVTTINATNNVKIGGLAYGYYIIDEVSENHGAHSASSLCMVNTANPNASANIKSDYPDVVKKIREDDDRETIGTGGWNDMADFEIGQTVPYQYTSILPNMNGYDTYYYAWHDVMDEALTFHKDSVSIVISDGTKGYTLNETEFSVAEKPDAGTTFKVEIKDIKAIVDREFDQINALGHNTYGQTVTVTYNATLNDKAADDTGRPGFENDVRLEFSNDPDGNGSGKTGLTPWNTVVCFNYKLDVLKTNDHDLALADAKFRLYSDEDCANEVYVKKTDNGYHVINRDSLGGTDHTGGTTPAEAVEMVSDENGESVIYGLDDHVYYLKETDAPAGYRAIRDPIKLTVDAADRNNYVKGDGATDKALVSLTYTAYVKQFVSGEYEETTGGLVTDVETGSGNLTVINAVGSRLPITGSAGTILLMGGGAAAMLAGFFMSKKKEEDME